MHKLYVRMSLPALPLLQPLPQRSPQDARFMTRHDLRRDLIPLVTRPRSFDSFSWPPRFFVVTHHPSLRFHSAIPAGEEHVSENLQHLQLSSEDRQGQPEVPPPPDLPLRPSGPARRATPLINVLET